MSADLVHIRQVMAEADCLFTEAEVEAAIDRVATQINAELAERNPVVFCVMNGGLIFSGKLLPKLAFPLEASTCTPPATATRPAAASCSGRPSRKSPLSTATFLSSTTSSTKGIRWARSSTSAATPAPVRCTPRY